MRVEESCFACNLPMKPKTPLLKVSGKVSNFPLADFCFCLVCGLIGLSFSSGLKQKWIQCLWPVQRQHRRRQYVSINQIPNFWNPSSHVPKRRFATWVGLQSDACCLLKMPSLLHTKSIPIPLRFGSEEDEALNFAWTLARGRWSWQPPVTETDGWECMKCGRKMQLLSIYLMQRKTILFNSEINIV